ncbi:MAG: phage holin family protein [Actinomycetota bacterium]
MAGPNPLDGAQEIQQLVVSYAKQETLEPLKHLGKYLGFGLSGAIFVFLGTFFAGLGVLRFFQTVSWFSPDDAAASTVTRTDLWASTVPYLITIVVLAVVLAILLMAMNRAKQKVR